MSAARPPEGAQHRSASREGIPAIWQVQQTRRFARVYKKLTNAALIADTDAAVATVADNPDVGEREKGDLGQMWVLKFRSQGQLYLLGYTREDEVRLVYLEALGPHENFYRDLKR